MRVIGGRSSHGADGGWDTVTVLKTLLTVATLTAVLTGCDKLFGLETTGVESQVDSGVVRPDGLMPCFADDFEDGAVDPARWTLINPANTPAVVEEISGHLQVTLPPLMNGIANGVIGTAFDASDGTFTANVAPSGTDGYWEVVVWYAVRGTSWFGFVVGGQNNFAAVQRIDGVVQDAMIGDGYYHGEPFWRLRHESTTSILHYEISMTGTTWSQVHSVVLPFALDGTQIQLVADTYQGGPATTKVMVVNDVAFDGPRCQP